MPSTRKLKTKDGRVFYEISVSRGRGKSRLTRRWYPPDGWSRKAIERELSAVAAEFERQSAAGETISRSEQRSGKPRQQLRPPRPSPSANTASGFSCRLRLSP